MLFFSTFAMLSKLCLILFCFTMKKLFVLMSFIALVASSAFAQKGETAVGVNLGYGSEISNLGIGAKFQYGITDAIRAEASFDYFLKKDGVSMWDVNLNAHYLFPVADKFKVYPLVGLTYAHCKASYDDENVMDFPAAYADDYGDFGDSDESDGKFGVNLGAGASYDLTEKLALNLEVKYQLISHFNQVVFGVGLAYKF